MELKKNTPAAWSRGQGCMYVGDPSVAWTDHSWEGVVSMYTKPEDDEVCIGIIAIVEDDGWLRLSMQVEGKHLSMSIHQTNVMVLR